MINLSNTIHSSSIDHDNDDSSDNCAAGYGGGFWWNVCEWFDSHLRYYHYYWYAGDLPMDAVSLAFRATATEP